MVGIHHLMGILFERNTIWWEYCLKEILFDWNTIWREYYLIGILFEGNTSWWVDGNIVWWNTLWSKYLLVIDGNTIWWENYWRNTVWRIHYIMEVLFEGYTVWWEYYLMRKSIKNIIYVCWGSRGVRNHVCTKCYASICSFVCIVYILYNV